MKKSLDKSKIDTKLKFYFYKTYFRYVISFNNVYFKSKHKQLTKK